MPVFVASSVIYSVHLQRRHAFHVRRRYAGRVQIPVPSCWGAERIQANSATEPQLTAPTPTAMSGWPKPFQCGVSAGGQHACGLVIRVPRSGGDGFSFGYCWGDNSSGQLGNGTMTNSDDSFIRG